MSIYTPHRPLTLARSGNRRGWLFALAFLVLLPFGMWSQTVEAATITLTEARACYDTLNGKPSQTTTPPSASCSQVCVAEGATVTDPKWTCINPNAAALAPEQLSNTVLDAKRIYGTSVGSAVCDQKVAQEKASCVNYAQTVVIDCINSWVTTLSSNELKDFLITNINTDKVGSCAATKLGAPKATVVNALDTVKSQVDGIVNTSVLAAEKADCLANGDTWNDSTNKCNIAGDTGPVCTGGALGWVLCPVMKLFNTANTFMANEIEKQLFVGPLTNGESIYLGTYPIWQTMVGVANLILVVGFLVVIFSQATSMGLSAYGIKKMLPRIIAAAILINLSYFICQIALDVVNVIGASVHGIINQGIIQVPAVGGFQTDFGDILTTLGTIALGTYAVISGALAFLVPLGLSAIMATMVIFLGLALRKIIIILLIIVAPLAFAAMILPGTEGLFKKWYKSFGGLLLMYPVIMAILYGSVLLSKIILASGGIETVDGTIDTSGTGNINIMLAYAVVGLGPAVGTYMFIKSSNKIFAAAGNAVNKMGSGAKKATDSWANRRHTERKDLMENRKVGRMSKRAEKWGDNDPRTKVQRMLTPAGRRIARLERNRQASEAGKLAAARMAANVSARSADPMTRARAESALDELDEKEATTQLKFLHNGDARASMAAAIKSNNAPLLKLSARTLVDSGRLEDLHATMAQDVAKGGMTAQQVSDVSTHLLNNGYLPKMKAQDQSMKYALADLARGRAADPSKGIAAANAKQVAIELAMGGSSYDTKAMSASNTEIVSQEEYVVKRQRAYAAIDDARAAVMIGDVSLDKDFKQGRKVIVGAPASPTNWQPTNWIKSKSA